MNCQRVQDLLPEHLDGHLSEAESGAVRDHLRSCPTCQRECSSLQHTLLLMDRLPAEDPSSALRSRFYAALEAAKREERAPRPFALAWSRLDGILASFLPSRPVAQAAFTLLLLAVGTAVGARFLSTPEPADNSALRKEIADLRSRLDSVDSVVATSLRQQSAGSRLQGILARLDAPASSDERAIAELVHAVAFDPSTNVRLCALESLYSHASRDGVRAAVLASLQREASPLVQVAMIDFLVSARDTTAAPALLEISRTPTFDKAVREAARRGLAQL